MWKQSLFPEKAWIRYADDGINSSKKGSGTIGEGGAMGARGDGVAMEVVGGDGGAMEVVGGDGGAMEVVDEGSGASNGSLGISIFPPVSCLKALAIARIDATNTSFLGSGVLLVTYKIRMLRGCHPFGFSLKTPYISKAGSKNRPLLNCVNMNLDALRESMFGQKLFVIELQKNNCGSVFVVLSHFLLCVSSSSLTT